MIKFYLVSQRASAASVDKGPLANYEAAKYSRAPLTQSGLFNLRLRALRRGVWFRVLSKVERGLIDLALMTVRKVRSLVLARSLIIVVEKLLSAMESEIVRETRTIGFSLAQRLSQIAQSWGNKSASNWAMDSDFARFLAICQMNKSDMFRD